MERPPSTPGLVAWTPHLRRYRIQGTDKPDKQFIEYSCNRVEYPEGLDVYIWIVLPPFIITIHQLWKSHVIMSKPIDICRAQIIRAATKNLQI